LQWIIELNVEAKTIKLLEENLYLRARQRFLDKPWKTITIKEKK
jgi:hypothetical protein